MSAPESHKLVWSADNRPFLVSGNLDRGYRLHELIVLPGWLYRRSHEAVTTAVTSTSPHEYALTTIIERALDDAIADGTPATDTEMLADEVAEALRTLPALMVDWEAL